MALGNGVGLHHGHPQGIACALIGRQQRWSSLRQRRCGSQLSRSAAVNPAAPGCRSRRDRSGQAAAIPSRTSMPQQEPAQVLWPVSCGRMRRCMDSEGPLPRERLGGPESLRPAAAWGPALPHPHCHRPTNLWIAGAVACSCQDGDPLQQARDQASDTERSQDGIRGTAAQGVWWQQGRAAQRQRLPARAPERLQRRGWEGPPAAPQGIVMKAPSQTAQTSVTLPPGGNPPLHSRLSVGCSGPS
jgi:hypothetical protein